MRKEKCKWWKSLRDKCRCRKIKLFRHLCKNIKQQTEILQGRIDKGTETIQTNVGQKAETINGSIGQLSSEINNQANVIVDKIDELRQSISIESNRSKSMFDDLLNHTCQRHNNSPSLTHISFRESSNKDFRLRTSAKSVIKDPGEEASNHWWKIVGIFLLLVIFAAFSLVPSICNGQTKDSLVTINSVKTNIPIKEPLNGYNHIYACSIAIDSTYYFSKDTGNFGPQGAINPSNDKATVHGVIHYNDTSWYILLYFLLIAIIVLIVVVLSIKFIMPLWSKKIDFKQKYLERRYNDYIRLSDEDREYERLQSKTELAIYEKREKARIDEWQRDNEHQRKLEIMEQERIAELSNVLKDLAKTKNIVTLKDPCDNGKTVTIERSILSDDCCTELKDIVMNHASQGDDCCTKIKGMLKCFVENIEDLEKIKALFCCNEKEKQDLINKIDDLLEKIKSQSSSGVQQVVNLGGERKGK